MNRISTLLGIRYPIIQGGMVWAVVTYYGLVWLLLIEMLHLA